MIISSDVSLLLEAPGTVLDGTRMINNFGSGGAPAPKRQDMIAGATRVGVGRRICERKHR